MAEILTSPPLKGEKLMERLLGGFDRACASLGVLVVLALSAILKDRMIWKCSEWIYRSGHPRGTARRRCWGRSELGRGKEEGNSCGGVVGN